MTKTANCSKLMKSIFMTLTAVLAIMANSWAANSWYIIAPGHSFTPGSGYRDTAGAVTLVAGEAFDLDIYSVETTTSYSTLAAPGQSYDLDFTGSHTTETFNPDNTTLSSGSGYTYQQNIDSDFVPNPLTSGIYTISCSGGSLASDTVNVPVQVVDDFEFTIGSFTAGSSGTITINAVDENDVLCSTFNGTAAVQILDAGANGSAISLGTVTFANGVYTAGLTLYHATPYARVYINKAAVNGAPSVTQTSSNFTINNAGVTGLLIIGPGQTLYQGTNSGNGRSGGSTQTSSQTVGSSFNMDVYAIDAYWNTVSSSANITLSSGPGDYSDTQSLSGGHYRFTPTLTKVDGSAVQMMASGGGLNLSVDNVPLAAGDFDHFGVGDFSASYEAGSSILLDITGYDSYGNTVASSNIPSDLSMEVLEGASTLSGPGSTLPWSTTSTVEQSNFTNGIYSGNLIIRKASTNFDIRLTYNSGSTYATNDDFTVTVYSSPFANKYLTILPGQTWSPGVQTNGVWGLGTGSSPTVQTAGSSFTATIRATDIYGNQIISNNDSVTWQTIVTDGNASASPSSITLSGGQATVGFTMTAATASQQLRILGEYSPTDTSIFVVQHTSLDHFSISAGTSQIAGNQFPVIIHAQDQYDNDVQTFSSNVYITCPALDYAGPTESVIQIDSATANYSSGSTTANWQVPSGAFSAGVATVNTRIYRATEWAGEAILFVSDVVTDTPDTYSGHIGQTAGMTVDAGIFENMFVIVPGLSHRPGADSNGNTYFAGAGYTGTTYSQESGLAFSVTVYATDAYWNKVTAINDNFTALTSPSTSDINSVSYALSDGYRQLDCTFSVDTDYSISITHPSVNNYTTPYSISSSTLYSFRIEEIGGIPGQVPASWIAGVPVNVSIVAYENAALDVATSYNGTANLSSTLDHNSTLKVIRPTSIEFINGYWQGQVTMFRANKTNLAAEKYNFTVTAGAASKDSTDFRVYHNSPEKLLVIEDSGMDLYSGLNPDVDPTGELSVQGQPLVQTAGSPLTKIDFYLCDAYWNKVTNPAQDANGTITITCSDPFPAQISGEGSFIGNQLSVNLLNGVYEADSSFYLYKVNGTTGQTIGVQMGGYTPYELGTNKNAVPVKHADQVLDISSPYNSQTRRFTFLTDYDVTGITPTAGVPFQVTVTVVDAYGNTLDSLNGATPFSSFSSVNLTANTDSGGNKSMWPTKLGTITATQWMEGVSYPWVYLYKKVTGSGQFLTAIYDFGMGSRTGVSKNFNVNANTCNRIVAHTTGMSYPDDNGAGGTYVDATGSTYPSSPPPADADVFNNFGSPSAQTAGTHATYLRAYTCDSYGNVVKNHDFDISLTSSDVYSPSPGSVAANAVNGYADFANTFRFHTRGTQTITFSGTTVTATSGTTPDITVNPGSYYGLQILVPGLTAIEGSGNSNLANGAVQGLPFGSWYSGVSTTTDTTYKGSTQVEGVYFAVTVQAVDLFGNFVSSAPADSIQLRSDDPDSGAEPNTGAYLNSTLSSGKCWFNSQLRSSGLRTLKPYDITNSAIIDGNESLTTAYVEISGTGQFHYEIIINGVRNTSDTVTIDCYPNTFNVRVEIVHDTLDQIVSLNKSYVLEAFNDPAATLPAAGSLAVTSGTTYLGIDTINSQSFTYGETIYIRARDLNASDPNPVASRISPRIIVAGPAVTMTPTPTVTPTATPTMTATPGIVLTIAKSVDKLETVQGDIIHYTLQYENTGGWVANNVRITDSIPTYTTYHDSNGAYDSVNKQVYWEGAVQPGASNEVWLEVKVASALPDTEITNEAAIICDGANTVTSNSVSTIVRAYIWTPTVTVTPTLPAIDIDDKETLAYPNPSRDTVTIVWRDEQVDRVGIDIYNISGEHVIHIKERENFSNYASVDIRDLPPGIYIYQVTLYTTDRKIKLKPKKIAVIK